jgi:hypothetical protein
MNGLHALIFVIAVMAPTFLFTAYREKRRIKR